MAVGERRIVPDGLRLLDATVDAVAAAYFASIDLSALGEPVVALAQQVYWDASDAGHWAPLTLAIPERKAAWCVSQGRAEALWRPYELDDDITVSGAGEPPARLDLVAARI